MVPYYNKPSQEGLKKHFLKIADTVDLPIFIYNIPGSSVVDMSNETIEKLSEHENIIGIKDASNDLSRPTYLKTYIKHKKFYQLSGEDATALPYLAAGGHGCISVTSNIAPKELAKMHDFWNSGDFSSAFEIHSKLINLHDALFCESSPGPVKYAAELINLCSSETRMPIVEIAERSKKQVREALTLLGLI